MSSTPRTSRSKIRMTRRKLSSGARTLLIAVVLTAVGLCWVWKQSWANQVSAQMLALEMQAKDLRNEGGNLRRQLLQLSEYTKVESQAKERLGMIFPTAPPDTIWTEQKVESAGLGSSIFFAAFGPRERPSTSHR